LAIRAGIRFGIFDAPERIDFTHAVASTQGGIQSIVTAFLDVFFSLNLLLFLFNLLPIPPLDGSGIVPLFISEKRAAKYMEVIHHSFFSIIGLIVAWNVFDYLYAPFHLAVINLLYLGIAHYH
jgi:Zn-dependent protease